jgi:hypothetical protein
MSAGLGLVTTVVLVGCARSPASTVETFYRSLGSGEITEAKSYLSAQVTGALGDPKLSAALATETERIRACGGIKSMAVDLQGEGDVRTGVATVTYSGPCPTKTERLKVIKEDGTWKIVANR